MFESVGTRSTVMSPLLIKPVLVSLLLSLSERLAASGSFLVVRTEGKVLTTLSAVMVRFAATSTGKLIELDCTWQVGAVPQ